MLQSVPLSELGARIRAARVAAGRSRFLWVRPALVGEVQFSERTEAGKLRHPVWRGFRPDKKPSDVVVEV